MATLITMNPKQKLAAASYARSALAAALALAATGNLDPLDLLKAALAALLPVAIRWANPKDLAFGRANQ